jgi:transposase
VRLDLEAEACPCCGGALHAIGETVSEILDWVPARLRVIRIRRPRYGCRACGTLHQAPAPERPIAKGLASPGLLAHVLISKYCDYLPLYRRSQIFARQGVELGRSTLANWVGGAAWWLEPLRDRLAAHVVASDKPFADDTQLPVLNPGRGRTKTGRWTIVCSLIATAKLNNREPYAYLKDVLQRMTNGHPANRLDDLLPWNWKPSAWPTC